MGSKVKVSGAQRDITKAQAKVSGSWREIVKGFAKVSGAWKLIDLGSKIFIYFCTDNNTSGNDSHTMKADSDGNYVWSPATSTTPYSVDRMSITVDPNNQSVYSSYQSIDHYILKQNSDTGEIIWSNRFNGDGTVYYLFHSVASGNDGHVYGCGYKYSYDSTYGDTYIWTFGKIGSDGVFVKGDSTLSTYAKYYDKTTVDSSGNVYFAGNSGVVRYSTSTFTKVNSVSSALNSIVAHSDGTSFFGGNTGVVRKYNNTDYSIAWQTSIILDATPVDMCLSNDGHIYVVSKATSNGYLDGISKLTLSGTLVKEKTWNSYDRVVPSKVRVDSSGNVYVSSYLNSVGKYRISKYDSDLNLIWNIENDIRTSALATSSGSFETFS